MGGEECVLHEVFRVMGRRARGEKDPQQARTCHGQPALRAARSLAHGEHEFGQGRVLPSRLFPVRAAQAGHFAPHRSPHLRVSTTEYTAGGLGVRSREVFLGARGEAGACCLRRATGLVCVVVVVRGGREGTA